MIADRWIVFDTETTGLLGPSAAGAQSQPRIIEVGAVVLKAGVIIEEVSFLIDPQQPITEEITKITGLRDADLVDKGPFAQHVPTLVELFLGARGLVAHNLPFDRGMLVSELTRCGLEHAFPYPPEQLCTASAYSHLKGHRMKLIQLYHHIMGKELAQTHRALDDAKALAEIVIKEGITE